MAKRLLITALAIIGLVAGSLATVYFQSPATDAASMSDFDAGNIIDDAVFYDSNALSASQIQSFLNSKVPKCDTQGSQPYLNTGKTVKQYWSARGEPAPYTCLKDWKQKTPTVTGESGICSYMKGYSSRTAAQIISDVAKACGISPKVLLVLLQKEQSLVTDNSPLRGLQYGSATGMGCPDTAGCDPKYDGYFNQVYGAARQFKLYRANPTNYNYVAGRDNYIQYNPNASCGGSIVRIKNQATAGLYNYTPYQPNAATKKVAMGVTAPCGAYGNKNFYLLFTSWFGSTKYAIKGSIKKFYDANNGEVTLGGPLSGEKSDGKGFWWQKFDRGYIAGQANTGYFYVKGSIGKYYDAHNGPSLLGKPIVAESKDSSGIWSQRFSNGSVQGIGSGNYVAVLGGIDKYYRSGNRATTLGLPKTERKGLGNGAWEQEFKNGFITGSAGTGYWTTSGAMRSHWVSNGKQNGRLGLPAGNVTSIGSGSYQLYSDGAVIKNAGNKYFSLIGSIGEFYLKNIHGSFDLLGFPTANEKNLNGAWQQSFEKGIIIKSHGVYRASYGSIYDRWNGHFNGPSGSLGYPIEETRTDPGNKMVWQRFEKGYIVKSPSSNKAWESKGSIRDYWASTGYQNGPYGVPTGPEVSHEDGSWTQDYENGTIRTLHGKSAGSSLN